MLFRSPIRSPPSAHDLDCCWLLRRRERGGRRLHQLAAASSGEGLGTCTAAAWGGYAVLVLEAVRPAGQRRGGSRGLCLSERDGFR